ncbi:MAG: asparagine synthase C-terminal domain-containing protein, partial [Chitinophagales bacterium]|nr:asparagine synthase C-terminal domain-containing protein [Chitinophagales bacterium]
FYSPSAEEVEEMYLPASVYSDVPLYGSSHIAGFFVMRLARQNGVTVVNDGQGSDEYLGGYLHSLYRIIGNHFLNFRLSKALSIWLAVGQREQFSFKRRMEFLGKSLLAALLTEQKIYELEYRAWESLCGDLPDLSLETMPTSSFNNFLYHLLLHTTLQPILHFEDRKSMAYSIESRVPFLDHRLVEFCFTLGTEDRISPKAETKLILRESLKGILPDAIYARKDKKGFVTPGETDWLNGPLSFLLDDNFEALHFLNMQKVLSLIRAYKNGRTRHAAMVWKLANMNHWLMQV